MIHSAYLYPIVASIGIGISMVRLKWTEARVVPIKMIGYYLQNFAIVLLKCEIIENN